MKTWFWIVPTSIILNCFLLILVINTLIVQFWGWPNAAISLVILATSAFGVLSVWRWFLDYQDEQFPPTNQPELVVGASIHQQGQVLCDLNIEIKPRAGLEVAQIQGWNGKGIIIRRPMNKRNRQSRHERETSRDFEQE